MEELRYTLVAEGGSDRALLPVLDWLLIENGVRCPIQAAWADLGILPLPDRPKLADKIERSLAFYPCDLLFVHRDADREPREKRIREIHEAIAAIPDGLSPAYVCVIPVRMQEAWLLIDEDAIKAAAGNRRYTGQLELPAVSRLESLPDPKGVLSQLLIQASDLNRRRLRSFRVTKHAERVTEFIGDYAPLRQLSAFAALEEEVSNAIRENGWHL